MTMETPSGQIFSQLDLTLADELAASKSIVLLEEPVTLNSKRKSRVYVKLRGELTSNPRLLSLVGRTILRTARAQKMMHSIGRQFRFIGIPAAGNILAAATAFAAVDAHNNELPLPFAYVRERRKRRGGDNSLVMGSPDETLWDVYLDNAITSGGSIRKIEPEFVRDGFDPKHSQHIFFLDREQGGMEALEEAGYQSLAAVFKITDMLYVFGKHELWPMRDVEVAIADIRNG